MLKYIDILRKSTLRKSQSTLKVHYVRLNKFYLNSLKAIRGSRQRQGRLERVGIYLVFKDIF